jgi:hypothetical protein
MPAFTRWGNRIALGIEPLEVEQWLSGWPQMIFDKHVGDTWLFAV